MAQERGVSLSAKYSTTLLLELGVISFHVGLQTTEFNNVFVFFCSGVAIQMSEALYAAPSLNSELTDAIFLQNLPSIVTSHVLNPQPGEAVLDMCAAPGDICLHTNFSYGILQLSFHFTPLLQVGRQCI